MIKLDKKILEFMEIKKETNDLVVKMLENHSLAGIDYTTHFSNEIFKINYYNKLIGAKL